MGFVHFASGPDAYGTHFFVGFLGNDPISEASASELRITIYPRYAIRTDITVTTADSTETYTIMDGVAMNLVIPSDFMGCAGGRYTHTQPSMEFIFRFGLY